MHNKFYGTGIVALVLCFGTVAYCFARADARLQERPWLFRHRKDVLYRTFVSSNVLLRIKFQYFCCCKVNKKEKTLGVAKQLVCTAG